MRRREQYKCPPQFQERLTRAGGINRYGEPNFIFVWGQSWTVRRGGTWEQDDGTYFRGYRDVLEDGRPCWILKKWNAPEIYGSPTLYYLDNMEESTGLQILGEFPYRGRYETLQPLVWKGLVNGRMVVEHMPLNSMLIDLVVPIIIASQKITHYQRKLALEALKEREDRDMLRSVEAKRHDANLAFRGPVSFARQGCRTSLVDQKVYQIQKHLDRAMNSMKGQGLGVSIH